MSLIPTALTATQEISRPPTQQCKHVLSTGRHCGILPCWKCRYSEFETKWPQIPQDEAGWLQRAQEVADVLATDAVVRDRENKSPRAEIALLKYAGLLKLLGPKKYGGGEQPWSVGYKAIRKVAEADG